MISSSTDVPRLRDVGPRQEAWQVRGQRRPRRPAQQELPWDVILAPVAVDIFLFKDLKLISFFVVVGLLRDIMIPDVTEKGQHFCVIAPRQGISPGGHNKQFHSGRWAAMAPTVGAVASK